MRRYKVTMLVLAELPFSGGNKKDIKEAIKILLDNKLVALNLLKAVADDCATKNCNLDHYEISFFEPKLMKDGEQIESTKDEDKGFH